MLSGGQDNIEQNQEEPVNTETLGVTQKSTDVQGSSSPANFLHVPKRFSASAYTKYFSLVGNGGASLKVQCKVLVLKKGNNSSENECACGSVFTLQKDTYSNLKKHLEVGVTTISHLNLEC